MHVQDQLHLKDLCHTVYRGLYLYADPNTPSETASALPRKSKVRELLAQHLGFRSYSGLAHSLPIEVTMDAAHRFITSCLSQDEVNRNVTFDCFGLSRQYAIQIDGCEACGAAFSVDQSVKFVERRGLGSFGDAHGIRCPECGFVLAGHFFDRNANQNSQITRDWFRSVTDAVSVNTGGFRDGYEPTQDDLDNHSDQMNPNNDAYWDSRGEDGRPDDWEDRIDDDD